MKVVDWSIKIPFTPYKLKRYHYEDEFEFSGMHEPLMCESSPPEV